MNRRTGWHRWRSGDAAADGPVACDDVAGGDEDGTPTARDAVWCIVVAGGSGRRFGAAKQFEADAVELAVRAHVRHVHTRYDELLGRGMPREAARARVSDDVVHTLDRWR